MFSPNKSVVVAISRCCNIIETGIDTVVTIKLKIKLLKKPVNYNGTHFYSKMNVKECLLSGFIR